MDRKELLEGLKEIVFEAGKLFENRSMADHAWDKTATDFVTEVDYAVQKYIQEKLYQLAPEVQFMGEEKDNSDIDRNGRVWILDPVDGTLNLLHNFRHSVISLALVEAGEVVLGIVYNPYIQELFTAVKGEGAYRNGKQISVSEHTQMKDCLCAIGTNAAIRNDTDNVFRMIRNIFDHCHDIRRIGTAAYELCYVAMGSTDAYMETNLKPWDFAAAKLMIEEAGGTLTDIKGNAFDLFSNADVVATNGKIHGEMLDILA